VVRSLWLVSTDNFLLIINLSFYIALLIQLVIFPHIWRIWLGNTIHLGLRFAPNDGERTKLYLRTYHAVKTPIVRQIFNFFRYLGDIFIERQDRRAMLTHHPFHSEPRMGEKFITGASPVIEYLRSRQS